MHQKGVSTYHVPIFMLHAKHIGLRLISNTTHSYCRDRRSEKLMLRVQAAKEKETESGQGISHINHQSVTPKDSWVRTMVLNKLSHRWVEIDEE